MKREQMKEIAEVLLNKAELGLKAEEQGMEIFNNNRRFIPYNSERRGMEQLLGILGIEYEYHYDDDFIIYGVTVGSETVMKQ